MTVRVTGLDETVEMLSGVSSRIADQTPAMQEISEALKAFIAERFRTRTAPDGTAWAPLAAHTIKYRKPDGSLEGSVYAEPRANGVTYGASASYAAYQNETRPFMPDSVDDPVIQDAKDTITTYVIDGE